MIHTLHISFRLLRFLNYCTSMKAQIAVSCKIIIVMLYGNYYYFLIKKTFSNVLSSPRLPRAHFETRARADKRVGICYTRVLE